MFLALFSAALCFAGEPELVRKYPAVFQRSGDTLTVTVKDGSKKYQDSFDSEEGRARHSAEAYFPKVKAAVLRHAFVGSELFDVISLISGHTIHAGAEAPLWRNGIFASKTKDHFLIGLCNIHDCIKLIDQPGTGPLDLLPHDEVSAGDIRCTVNRHARTASCSPQPKAKK